MPRTTINLEVDVYRKLVKEAVEKFGTTRTLSRLINEKLKSAEESMGAEASVVGSEKMKKLSIVERTFGAWDPGPSGAEYVRKLRRESEKRFKRLKEFGL